MVDYKELANEFSKYGINNFQAWDAVIPLDKAFGLDPNKHDDGINPYGVADFSLFDRGVSIKYYKGNIFHEHYACSSGRLKECGARDKRLLTPQEEQGVYDYCMMLINNRKAEIERNKYWLEHLDEFCNNCFEYAKEYFKKSNPKYRVALTKGNSQADKRVSPAIVLYSGDWQVGYIRIFQSRFGDIRLDAWRMCHSERKVTDPSNIDEVMEYACHWISD